ncbi:hypothetical protein [Streptomyces sp. NBRC 110465]|uniref:hypothetical protein n=1 Tax=Streptomyces sp. NBRC 110465 TaxID=1897621 RepID=UPI001F3A1EE2|nr:hypothetical protein [Streptomyces sp. NBRC 110465]
MDGLLVGGQEPVGDGSRRPTGERRHDGAARRVRIGVALFEPFWGERSYQVAHFMSGTFGEQQHGAVRRVAERGGVGDPFVLDGAAEFAAVPDPGHQVLLPRGVGEDLDGGEPPAGQLAREVAGGVADEPATTRVHGDVMPLRARHQLGHHGLGVVHRRVVDAVVVPTEAGLREGGARQLVLLPLGDGHDPGLPGVRRMICASAMAQLLGMLRIPCRRHAAMV